MNPKISVIVPVYNCEKYIERCLRSIVSQTFTDFEVIVVNDGSQDKSQEICERLALEDARIRVYYKENGGSNSARKYGVDKAVGDYIRFVDSDDTIPDNSLALMLEKATIHQLDIVQGANFYEDSKGNKTISFLGKEGLFTNIEFIGMVLRAQINTGPCASLYRKELFNDNTFNLPKDVKLNEDKYMNVCLGIQAQKVGLFNDAIIYNYFQNTASTTQSYQFTSTKPFEHLYERIETVLKEACLYEQFKDTLEVGKLYAVASCSFHNLSLVKDRWSIQVIKETAHIPLSRTLSITRTGMKYPHTLFPVLYVINAIKRKWRVLKANKMQ